jgi:hypothetical protein
MFKANLEKLKWCLVWILHQQACDPKRLTEILFQAEIKHLNLHARPITGVNYYKGHLVYCLDIETIYESFNPLLKPLPPINTQHLSVSDIECLSQALTSKLTNSPYLNRLPPTTVINYREMITNPEIWTYLAEHDPLSIVL